MKFERCCIRAQIFCGEVVSTASYIFRLAFTNYLAGIDVNLFLFCNRGVRISFSCQNQAQINREVGFLISSQDSQPTS